MKKITVVIVGDNNHELMQHSLEQTIAATPDIEKVIVFGNKHIMPGTEFVPIEDKITIASYNKFCIKHLNQYIQTDFVLVTQYDGMAVNGSEWTDDFYKYDYIGAVWPSNFTWIPQHNRVGNGGFSLRSKRLLEALQDQNIKFDDNEDAVICQKAKKLLVDKYQINYAPIELADKFSNEWNNPNGSVFGFHGIFNFPRYFSDNHTAELFSKLTVGSWYNDQLENFLGYCQQHNYINSLLQLEAQLSKTR